MTGETATDNEPRIAIDLGTQQLRVLRRRSVVCQFPISSSAFGMGTQPGSLKTPTGQFRIAEKIGAGTPHGTVFRGRVAVDDDYDDGALGNEDAILSRILWLDGVEAHNANTRERFIYIHGTNHEGKIGQPASHGCIRMRNADVITLFDLVAVGTEVVIAG